MWRAGHSPSREIRVEQNFPAAPPPEQGCCARLRRPPRMSRNDSRCCAAGGALPVARVSEYIPTGTVGPKLEEFRQPSEFPADSITVPGSKGPQSKSEAHHKAAAPKGLSR